MIIRASRSIWRIGRRSAPAASRSPWNAFMRHGGWQTRIGNRVAGKTLVLLGLGRLGSAVARVGLAFGMKAIAWSQNLTAEKAAEQGVERVEKDELFRRSDILSVHLVL